MAEQRGQFEEGRGREPPQIETAAAVQDQMQDQQRYEHRGRESQPRHDDAGEDEREGVPREQRHGAAPPPQPSLAHRPGPRPVRAARRMDRGGEPLHGGHPAAALPRMGSVCTVRRHRLMRSLVVDRCIPRTGPWSCPSGRSGPRSRPYSSETAAAVSRTSKFARA